MKLEISLFKFDKNSDYLPYYTKHFIKLNDEQNLLDILNTINNQESFSYENSEDFAFVVNGIYTKASTSISKIADIFGTDLRFEPLSQRRAYSDLLIDENDFKNKLKLFEDFIDEEDIKKYESYKIYFYASNTINYEYDYVGDALVLLAYDLIQKDKSKEENILKVLKEYEYSLQYHTSLEKRVLDLPENLEDKISFIRKKLNLTKNMEESTNIDFGSFEQKKIKYDFSNFNIAYYRGLDKEEETLKLLSKLKAKIIKTPSMYFDLTLETFHINKEFTFKLTSSVMLDAFDNGADFILVDDNKTFELFDSNRKALSKASGREVIIPIIHKNELAKLAYGEHEEVKKLLTKHKVNPEII